MYGLSVNYVKIIHLIQKYKSVLQLIIMKPDLERLFMKVVVCDDNRDDVELLSKYLMQYSEEFNQQFNIIQFDSGETLLENFKEEQYQIYFLDIYMSGMSGVEVASKIRSWDDDCKIIFTTYSNEHMTDGFDVHATHYLVKPVSYEGVCECMKRCKRLFNEEVRFLEVAVQGQILRLPLKGINYIEAVRNGIIISYTTDKIKCYDTLSNIRKKLDDSIFLTCHRGFIVNMRRVKALAKDGFLMYDDKFVPIRQKGRNEIKTAFKNFIFNSIRHEV